MSTRKFEVRRFALVAALSTLALVAAALAQRAAHADPYCPDPEPEAIVVKKLDKTHWGLADSNDEYKSTTRMLGVKWCARLGPGQDSVVVQFDSTNDPFADLQGDRMVIKNGKTRCASDSKLKACATSNCGKDLVYCYTLIVYPGTSHGPFRIVVKKPANLKLHPLCPVATASNSVDPGIIVEDGQP